MSSLVAGSALMSANVKKVKDICDLSSNKSHKEACNQRSKHILLYFLVNATNWKMTFNFVFTYCKYGFVFAKPTQREAISVSCGHVRLQLRLFTFD